MTVGSDTSILLQAGVCHTAGASGDGTALVLTGHEVSWLLRSGGGEGSETEDDGGQRELHFGWLVAGVDCWKWKAGLERSFLRKRWPTGGQRIEVGVDVSGKCLVSELDGGVVVIVKDGHNDDLYPHPIRDLDLPDRSLRCKMQTSISLLTTPHPTFSNNVRLRDANHCGTPFPKRMVAYVPSLVRGASETSRVLRRA